MSVTIRLGFSVRRLKEGMPQRVWNGLQWEEERRIVLVTGDVRQCFTLREVTTKVLKKQRQLWQQEKWKIRGGTTGDLKWGRPSTEEQHCWVLGIALLADSFNCVRWEAQLLLLSPLYRWRRWCHWPSVAFKKQLLILK